MKWISTKQELPPALKDVLLIFSHSGQIYKTPQVGFRYSTGESYCVGIKNMPDKAAYWSLLPEFPQELIDEYEKNKAKPGRPRKN